MIKKNFEGKKMLVTEKKEIKVLLNKKELEHIQELMLYEDGEMTDCEDYNDCDYMFLNLKGESYPILFHTFQKYLEQKLECSIDYVMIDQDLEDGTFTIMCTDKLKEFHIL